MNIVLDRTVKNPGILSSRTCHENRVNPETYCIIGSYRNVPRMEYFGMNFALVIEKHAPVY
ncbi:MAG: hypothetical protein HOD32_09560 [Nitrospina sp.]|nr:hypothetical protein [Nitrospina sp.]